MTDADLVGFLREKNERSAARVFLFRTAGPYLASIAVKLGTSVDWQLKATQTSRK
jgi:hypothetical protein